MDQFSDQLNIETPELVDLELPVAGVGSRFIAILIDYLIWGAGFVVLFILAMLVLPSLSVYSRLTENWAAALFTLLFFLLFWGYFTLFEALWSGQTPGKRVARIRVIQKSGRPIGIFESMVRNFIRVIDQIPIIYGVGVLFIFVTKQHQRLGDLAAGTLVVREQESEAPAWGNAPARTFTAPSFLESARRLSPATAPPPANFVPVPANHVAKLGGAELEVLEGFFARRLDMSLETRASLAGRIAKAISAKAEFAIPEGASTENFLESVAHQLRESARYKG